MRYSYGKVIVYSLEYELSQMETLLQIENAEKNSTSKSTIKLARSMQVRALFRTDYDEKTAYYLWNFFEYKFSKSNEQAIQNVRCQLGFIVHA